MDFYGRYPMMRPHVGRHFSDGDKPSILLVGESHYLPNGSTRHTDPATWYSGSSADLSNVEVEWISTARIIELASKEKFKNKAHSIWKNSFGTINANGPRYSDFTRVADDVAFYNFFLRPALQGQSLRVSPEDAQFANAAFARWCEELKPTSIVFLSMLAYRCLSSTGVPPSSVAVVPHPASQWWNRSAKKYGGKTGRQLLAGIVGALDWPHGEVMGT
jgi:hypothetical protein